MTFSKLLLPLFLCLVSAVQAGISVGKTEYDVSPVELGAKGEWVLYPKGAARVEGNKRWLTKRVLVELDAAVVAPNLAKVPGVSAVKAKGKYRVVSVAGGPTAAVDGAARLGLLRGVAHAEPLLARQMVRRFVPNDPYFAYNASNPGYQWNLSNTGQNGGTVGVDINVSTAWDFWKGNGVTIGIVDDGMEITHPDLAAHVNTAIDIDFNDADADPSPGAGDFHGTSCAGVAGAVGNNSLGGSGVAPEATLVGVRLIAGPSTDEDEADAFTHEMAAISVKSNSWGPDDGGFLAAGPSTLGQAALIDATTNGRGGLGTVFVWAAGNGNQNGDDSNYDGWAGSPYAMAVSAIGDNGKQSYYSEPGSNVLVCAPSNGVGQGVTTTDRIGSVGYNTSGGGDYADTNFTRTFGGTSAACPTVAGVVALMLHSNPALGYRDVQEILVKTAKKNDEFNGAWVTNGAGFHFNVNYGAGLVDATAATTMATTWTNLPALQTKSIAAPALALEIPDGSATGASHTFTVAEEDNLRVEHVTVHVNATHEFRGNLEWWLTSPSGVSARLARARANDSDTSLDYTFMATHFWGERNVGEWKLRVVDDSVGYVGTLNSATITFFGTPATGPLPLPVITSTTFIVGRQGAVINYQMTASNLPTGYDIVGLPDGLTFNTTTGVLTGEPVDGGASTVLLSATNATGTVSEFGTIYILSADPLLAEAVDLPATDKLVPFADADWFKQTTVTHDGVDAAQSGDIGDDQLSGMELTVNGPANVSFKWKVSSEPGYDYLILVVDGVIRGFISGEQDWVTFNYAVGPGSHNVDFDYFKDETVSTGSDAGWIDELTISPITDPPVVTAATTTAYDGVAFRFLVTGTNAPTSFGAAGLPPGMTISPTTGLISGITTVQAVFNVTVSATNAFGTGSANLTLTVGSLSEGLAAAVEAPAQSFVTSGAVVWAPQTIYAHDGVDSARSGAIPDLSQSVMTTQVQGPAIGSFYWGISSEATYDFLRFYIDDVEALTAISGEVGWTKKDFTLPAGMHTLKWAYIKDDYVKSGLDAGFVDQLVITQDLDQDGYYTDVEAHFGTSDADANSRPLASLTSGAGGVTIHFPSVDGKTYRVECSTDLVTWNLVATVTATGATSSYTDATALTGQRYYYRVVVP